jgi:spermidine synthase
LNRTWHPRFWIASSLLASGAGALTLELCWIRAAADAFGGTVWALATVSALFLGGAAFGAWISGRLLKRMHPLRAYAAAEICIGSLSILLPMALPGWTSLAPSLILPFWEIPSALVVVQTLVLAPLIALPCVAMGVTIPAAVRAWGESGASVSIPYGLNTLGATAGVLLGGWVLPARFGLSTIVMTVGLALVVLGAAWLWATRGRAPLAKPVVAIAATPLAHSERVPTPWLLAAAGGIALTIEVLWARLGGLIFGSTVAAGTFVLSATIFWLAVGSLLAPAFRRVTQRIESPAALALALASVGLVAGLWLLPYAPLGYLHIIAPSGVEVNAPLMDSDAQTRQLWYAALTNDARLILAQALAVFLFLGPGMLAVGLATPLLLDTVARATPRRVGRAYAANAIGSLSGALLTLISLVILPSIIWRKSESSR